MGYGSILPVGPEETFRLEHAPPVNVGSPHASVITWSDNVLESMKEPFALGRGGEEIHCLAIATSTLSRLRRYDGTKVLPPRRSYMDPGTYDAYSCVALNGLSVYRAIY